MKGTGQVVADRGNVRRSVDPDSATPIGESIVQNERRAADATSTVRSPRWRRCRAAGRPSARMGAMARLAVGSAQRANGVTDGEPTRHGSDGLSPSSRGAGVNRSCRGRRSPGAYPGDPPNVLGIFPG